MSIITISFLVLFTIILIVVLTSVTKLNAFASLFIVSFLLAILALPGRNVIEILQLGFGNTIASIGFLIIFGAIIAVVLEKTGGAISIANYILSRLGSNRAASAIGITGYIVGLPIFCDSGYIIMSGIAKSLSKTAKIALPFIAFVLATSLYSVHCLTPTHPGALAASDILHANIGLLILVGSIFAIPAAMSAYFWIKWQTKKIAYLDPEPSESGSGTINNGTDPVESSSIAIESNNDLPSVRLSLLPIVTPLLLIAIGSILQIVELTEENLLVNIFSFLGQPIVALLTGALLSLPLLKQVKMKEVNSLIESAIEKAGPILIVTGAGGMFGLVIKETGVGAYAGEFLLQTGIGLAIPFLITSILKTAQGSSTVAIITAASLIAPMLPTLGLDTEAGKILVMLAMGAGSMMVSHANDSYFWVVSRFSGIASGVTLKVYSSATIVMGLTTFIFVWLTSLLVL